MNLQQIVPWGRSYGEYIKMFGLTAKDQDIPILGCGDGPASFNAECTARGGSVISLDPLYAYSAGAIRDRIAVTADTVMDEVKRHSIQFVWRDIPSPEALLRVRMEAMTRFLDDYAAGRAAGRYVQGALPHLPFRRRHFGLVLCSHLLFTYTAHLDGVFHYEAIRAMLDVGHELRVFPLLALDGARSPLVDPVCGKLRRAGFTAQVEQVPYEFQRGGNEMLRVTRSV